MSRISPELMGGGSSARVEASKATQAMWWCATENVRLAPAGIVRKPSISSASGRAQRTATRTGFGFVASSTPARPSTGSTVTSWGTTACTVTVPRLR